MNQSSEAELDLAGLVHDLNNVFETITEAAELLADDGSAAELAATIARSVARGRRLVNGIGESARSSTDLDLVVGRAAGFLRDMAAILRGVDVQIETRLGEGLRVPGPAPEWERVFMNLFLNAAQAMSSGGKINVSAGERDGNLAIEVTDNGPGIPSGILMRIFEPKFSTRERHSGLGLHIVDTIVRRYGGTVHAENCMEGVGARFLIEMPLQRG